MFLSINKIFDKYLKSYKAAGQPIHPLAFVYYIVLEYTRLRDVHFRKDYYRDFDRVEKLKNPFVIRGFGSKSRMIAKKSLNAASAFVY